jgi:glycosyltransferase involved in cell wall biosynthesis
LEQLRREPFVKWAGSVPREKLPWFYNALNVLVLPSLTTASWKEQFGRVLVEAQSCGVPVLGSDSGAIPEVIGEAGLVFPENDDVAMLAALERLRVEKGLCELFSQAGRLQATRLYSWEAIAAQMRDIYLHLSPVGQSAGTKKGLPPS